MKKAFMRGVCALNLEAMAMFQEPEGKNGGCEHSSVSYTHDIYFDTADNGWLSLTNWPIKIPSKKMVIFVIFVAIQGRFPPSELRQCWLDSLTCKNIVKMTFNLSIR